jgi:hypothetical protein
VAGCGIRTAFAAAASRLDYTPVVTIGRANGRWQKAKKRPTVYTDERGSARIFIFFLLIRENPRKSAASLLVFILCVSVSLWWILLGICHL